MLLASRPKATRAFASPIVRELPAPPAAVGDRTAW